MNSRAAKLVLVLARHIHHCIRWQTHTKLTANAKDEVLLMARCFTVFVRLSYPWRHQKLVLWVKSMLEAAGFKVWVDTEQMSSSILESMAHAVEKSSAVIVCVCEEYRTSEACRTEAEYAYSLKKPLVPIKPLQTYKPTGWLGALVSGRLWFNFNDKEQSKGKIEGLIKELQRLGIEPGAPTATQLPDVPPPPAPSEDGFPSLPSSPVSSGLPAPAGAELAEQITQAVCARLDSLETTLVGRLEALEKRLAAVEKAVGTETEA
eukprot:m.121171 g.121171  ORF g.121171 m.121171 type:complete len:263 (-) comp16528_c0_seq5:180-968(-)